MDESIFQPSDAIKHAWSNRNENVLMRELPPKSGPSIKVLAAIAVGHMSFRTSDKWYDSKQVRTFIMRLRRQSKYQKIAIFCDNASIHSAKIVKKYCKARNIPLLFNLPYEPDFNPIEHIFASMK